MPLTIGGGNLDVGLKYLDQEARDRAAALDEARFQQTVSNQNQQLQQQRTDSYNRAQGDAQRTGLNFLQHANDQDASARAAALVAGQQRDFHEDDLGLSNRKLSQQDTLNQRDNDRAMETAQLRAQALEDSRQQAEGARQERNQLIQQRAAEQAQAREEAQIRQELQMSPEYKVALSAALENKDFPEEAQKHVEHANAIEAQIRARHAGTQPTSPPAPVPEMQADPEASARASALSPTPEPAPAASSGVSPFDMNQSQFDAMLGGGAKPAPRQLPALPEDNALANAAREQLDATATTASIDQDAPPTRDWMAKPPRSKAEHTQMLLDEKRVAKKHSDDLRDQSIQDRKDAKEKEMVEKTSKLKKEILSEATNKSFATWSKNAQEAGFTPDEITDAHPFTRTLKDIASEIDNADDKKAYLEYVTAELNGVPPANRNNKYYKAALPLKSDLPDNETVTPEMAWKKDAAAKWAELKKTPGARIDILRALKTMPVDTQSAPVQAAPAIPAASAPASISKPVASVKKAAHEPGNTDWNGTSNFDVDADMSAPRQQQPSRFTSAPKAETTRGREERLVDEMRARGGQDKPGSLSREAQAAATEAMRAARLKGIINPAQLAKIGRQAVEQAKLKAEYEQVKDQI